MLRPLIGFLVAAACTRAPSGSDGRPLSDGPDPHTDLDSGPGPTEPGWQVQTVDTVLGGRRTGNVGITTFGGSSWIVWDEAENDQSDDHLWIARSTDTIAPPELVRVADTSGKPAIASEGTRVYVVALTDRDAAGVTVPERQLAVWVLDTSTGLATSEPVATDHPELSYGRADAAWGGGGLHVCYVVHHPTVLSDELWCRVRDPDGRWAAPEPVSRERANAEDHPFVHLADDGTRRVGATATTAFGRAPAISLAPDEPLQLLVPDVAHGEDVGLAEHGGVLHAVWRESEAGSESWSLVHQTCNQPDPTQCAPGVWDREILAGPAQIDAPDLALTPDGLLVLVWTEDDRIRVGWRCNDTFVVEIPDPAEGFQSTERGQPSLAMDRESGRLHVVYWIRHESGDTIRLASRDLPTCP